MCGIRQRFNKRLYFSCVPVSLNTYPGQHKRLYHTHLWSISDRTTPACLIFAGAITFSARTVLRFDSRHTYVWKFRCGFHIFPAEACKVLELEDQYYCFYVCLLEAKNFFITVLNTKWMLLNTVDFSVKLLRLLYVLVN